MSKKSIIIAVLVVVVVGVIVYFSANKSTTPAPAAGQGKAIIGIADDSKAIRGVTSVMITVDKVEVQSGTNGWVIVSNGTKQYDLLQLKASGAVALLADANLPIGTYDQIRLTISRVDVTANGTTQQAKLPSGTFQIAGRLVINEGKTATAVLDINAEKSLLLAADGTFIMAPVINLHTKKDATVDEQSDNTLKINGGTDEDNVTVGMDEHGDIKDNFQMDANAKIEIDKSGMMHVTTSTQDQGGDKNKSGNQNGGGDQSKGKNQGQ
jgi:Domain of unknown function (DUF4382)